MSKIHIGWTRRKQSRCDVDGIPVCFFYADFREGGGGDFLSGMESRKILKKRVINKIKIKKKKKKKHSIALAS